MSELIETIEYRGYEIEVCYDTDPESPDQWENEDVFIVYDHRQFEVRRKEFDPREIFDYTNKTKRMFYKGYYVFVLNTYIHSGVSLSLGNTYPFNDRWDVSTTGYVLVKRTKGWSWTKDKAYKIAESEVEVWNQYLSGEVYGYNSETGGCCGFYGDKGRKQMIEEAKSEIDFDIKNKFEKSLNSHLSQLKIWIKNRVPLIVRQPLKLELI